MRRIITAFLMVSAVSVMAMSQWQFSRTFIPAGIKVSGNGIHGIAVDKAGKVWIEPYDVSDSLIKTGTTSTYQKVRCIYVYNPDGTAVDTIKTILIGSTRDTLFNSGRGLASDPTGDNIFLSTFDMVYKINATTRQGVSKVQPVPNNSLTAVAVDSLGEVFAGLVVPGIGGIKIYGSNMAFIGNVTDTSRGFSRTLAVSNNGNDVYWPAYTNSNIVKYHSANGSLGPYTPTDTLAKGAVCESMTWRKKTGHLWISGGYRTFPPTGSNLSPAAWYAYDLTAKKVVDGFFWNPVPGGASRTDPRPRGIAFSPGGDTCYVAMFNLDSATVQMWTKIPTSVQQLPRVGQVPEGYALEQNFPNPFNPTTTIQFTLAKPGLTSLFIYDMLGRDIATLMHQEMAAGTFRVSFDASRIPSGTYIYELRSGDARIMKKMTLVK